MDCEPLRLLYLGGLGEDVFEGGFGADEVIISIWDVVRGPPFMQRFSLLALVELGEPGPVLGFKALPEHGIAKLLVVFCGLVVLHRDNLLQGLEGLALDALGLLEVLQVVGL